MYAIVGAGALQAVAEGCSQGRLLSCSCRNVDPRPAEPIRTLPPPGGAGRRSFSSFPGYNVISSEAAEQWQRGGCTDDLTFAYVKSRQFVDVEPEDFRSMVQSHNYEAGRLVRFSTDGIQYTLWLEMCFNGL